MRVNRERCSQCEPPPRWKQAWKFGISERLEHDIPIKTAKLEAFPPPHLFHEYIVYSIQCVLRTRNPDPWRIELHPQLPAPMGSISSSRPNCFSNSEALSFTTDSMLSWRNITTLPLVRQWRKPFFKGTWRTPPPSTKIGKNKSTTGYILGFPGLDSSWSPHNGTPVSLPRGHGLHHQLVQRLVQVGRDKDHQQNDEGGKPLMPPRRLDVGCWYSTALPCGGITQVTPCSSKETMCSASSKA